MCEAARVTLFKRKHNQLKKWKQIVIFYKTLLLKLTTSKLYILHQWFFKLYPKSPKNFYKTKSYG